MGALMNENVVKELEREDNKTGKLGNRTPTRMTMSGDITKKLGVFLWRPKPSLHFVLPTTSMSHFISFHFPLLTHLPNLYMQHTS